MASKPDSPFGVLSSTGLGVKFASIIAAYSGGHLLVALFLEWVTESFLQGEEGREQPSVKSAHARQGIAGEAVERPQA